MCLRFGSCVNMWKHHKDAEHAKQEERRGLAQTSQKTTMWSAGAKLLIDALLNGGNVVWQNHSKMKLFKNTLRYCMCGAAQPIFDWFNLYLVWSPGCWTIDGHHHCFPAAVQSHYSNHSTKSLILQVFNSVAVCSLLAKCCHYLIISRLIACYWC